MAAVAGTYIEAAVRTLMGAQRGMLALRHLAVAAITRSW